MLGENLMGRRFGHLTVIEWAPNLGKDRAWKCRCDCGRETIARARHLKNGRIVSCGCHRIRSTIQRNRENTRHGESRGRLYRVWRGMLARCECPSAGNYKDYGGRGITVCEEWHDYLTFRAWAIQSGYDPTAKYSDCTIDRKNVNGDYCPENCRWVNAKQQANNRRKKKCLTPTNI